MSFFHNLKLQFSPPKKTDPDFGPILFRYISNHPERSYWECEWVFPKTGAKIFVALPDDEDGPKKEGKEFYLSLVSRFDSIIERARPKLAEVSTEWLKTPLPEDIFSIVKLSGFDVEEIGAKPLNWSASFETTGEKWLGIQIPFIGEEAQRATVDT